MTLFSRLVDDHQLRQSTVTFKLFCIFVSAILISNKCIMKSTLWTSKAF